MSLIRTIICGIFLQVATQISRYICVIHKLGGALTCTKIHFSLSDVDICLYSMDSAWVILSLIQTLLWFTICRVLPCTRPGWVGWPWTWFGTARRVSYLGQNLAKFTAPCGARQNMTVPIARETAGLCWVDVTECHIIRVLTDGRRGLLGAVLLFRVNGCELR